MQSLKVGDTLRLSEFTPSPEDLRIESLDNSPGPNLIIVNQDYYILARNQKSYVKLDGFDDRTWLLVEMGSDRILQYSRSELPILFAPDAVIIDELTDFGTSRQVADIRALFNAYGVWENEDLHIMVENRKVIRAVLYYHP